MSLLSPYWKVIVGTNFLSQLQRPFNRQLPLGGDYRYLHFRGFVVLYSIVNLAVTRVLSDGVFTGTTVPSYRYTHLHLRTLTGN